MSAKISFIIPCRGRTTHLQGLLNNLSRYYNGDFRVILCEQADDLLFKKGQLSNLGFKKSNTDIVVFINLDYRFLEYVDLIGELEKAGKPIIPFLYSMRVVEKNGMITDEAKVKNFLNKKKKKNPKEKPGGCQVFTREQFVESNGHTNLIFGWGSDDVVLGLRTNFVHLPFSMGHVMHDKNDGYPGRARMKAANRTVYKRYPDAEFDSFRETLADEAGHQFLSPNVEKFKFVNIHVPDDYKEMERYKIQLKNEREVLGL